MDRSLSTLYTLYARYRTPALLIVAGAVMLLGFGWYLPGAYHADSSFTYHQYSFRSFRFTNVIDVYTNRDLHGARGLRYILNGPGIEYPALLTMLIRGTASVTGGSVPAYLLVNDAIIFLSGLLAVALLARWPGARPWLFVASPILLLFAGYNWDLVPIALILAAFLMLQRSTDRPSRGRGYNLALDIAAFALLSLAVWLKLFPIVFLGAALVARARSGLWRAAAYGAAVFVVISALINVPLLVANYGSWRYFFHENTYRHAEPSFWFLVVGLRDLSAIDRPGTTAVVTRLSLLVVAIGGLGITALAWRSLRREIMMPLGCLLLVWWFSFNKIFDPNFDLWLLFGLAALGAPFWLNAALMPLSIFWYIMAFDGLGLSTFPTPPEVGGWFVMHVVMSTLAVRLAVLAALLVWFGRQLVMAERVVGRAPAVPARAVPLAPAMRS